MRRKTQTKGKKIVYMLRTKPKYQFPLTDEERDELNYFVAKIYNPISADELRFGREKDKASAM